MPPGNWCDGNASIPCPTGRYGSVEQLGSPSCSGACIPGYFCPKGSTSPTEKPCPPGTYGSTDGLGSSACSGECLEGYYCPVASTKRNQNPCGDAKYFCPAGSPAPIPVWKGYFSQGGNVDGTTRVNQTKCPKGSFCKFGLKFDCPAGQYGNELGLIINSCSGKAAPGYYTPPGSTSATESNAPQVDMVLAEIRTRNVRAHVLKVTTAQKIQQTRRKLNAPQDDMGMLQVYKHRSAV